MILALTAIAGGLGGIARFLVDTAVNRHNKWSLPLGTVVVNASACLFLGLLTGYALVHPHGTRSTLYWASACSGAIPRSVPPRWRRFGYCTWDAGVLRSSTAAGCSSSVLRPPLSGSESAMSFSSPLAQGRPLTMRPMVTRGVRRRCGRPHLPEAVHRRPPASARSTDPHLRRARCLPRYPRRIRCSR